MSVAIVTGAGGLVGSEGSSEFCKQGYDVVGIDNDMRRYFFGDSSSTEWQTRRLQADFKKSFRHEDADIRDESEMGRIFKRYGSDISLVLHCAGGPGDARGGAAPRSRLTTGLRGNQ